MTITSRRRTVPTVQLFGYSRTPPRERYFDGTDMFHNDRSVGHRPKIIQTRGVNPFIYFTSPGPLDKDIIISNLIGTKVDFSLLQR